MTTFLETPDDVQWLLDTHLHGCTLPPFTVALLEGSEDAPSAIVLYEHNHVNSLTLRLTPDENGDFQCRPERY